MVVTGSPGIRCTIRKAKIDIANIVRTDRRIRFPMYLTYEFICVLYTGRPQNGRPDSKMFFKNGTYSLTLKSLLKSFPLL